MRIEDKNIILEGIPIIEHTSKYRLKRKIGNSINYLVLQEDQNITSNDYIEWQISYDIKIDNIYNDLKDEGDLLRIFGEGKPNRLRNKIISEYKKCINIANKRDRKKEFINKLIKILESEGEPLIYKRRKDKPIMIIMNELSDFIKYAYIHKIIKKKEIQELIDFANGIKSYLDDEAQINREQSSEKKSFHGFDLLWEKYPVFIKNINPGIYVEISKKHMQYAIGFQNMIYLCIKATEIIQEDGSAIIGKHPQELGKISYKLDKSVLLETTKAFIIASETHKNDVLDILNAIIKIKVEP